MTTATSPAVRTADDRRRTGSIVWHVGALVVLAVVLYPVVWVVGAAFKPSKDIIASLDLLPARPVWANFSGLADGISGISISTFFVNSLTYAVLAVVGVVLSSSLTAYAFAKIRFAGRNLLFTLMIGTLLLPYHVLLIPQYVMFRKLELVDTLVPLV
ncbi:carbohydrate ABC transporter permease, partial [Streptomyces sp. TRM76130]|nr:carbohydrate ABC transporter permease [Streptomyces sp. TRM76130]